MPYEAPGEAFFGGFDTAHYVKKVAQKAYRPSGAMTKSSRPVSAGRAKNIAKQEAKRCMQRLAEKKHLTTAIGHSPIGGTGVVDSLVIQSQGSSATTRTGNQVHISKLTLECFAGLAAAANSSDNYRMIIGWDTEANGAAVGVTTVLETAAATGVYNRDQVKPGGRIQILYDKWVTINNTAATVTTPGVILRVHKKLDKVVYYQSNAGTISDVLKNNLFVIQISGNGTVNSFCNAQICYTDL